MILEELATVQPLEELVGIIMLLLEELEPCSYWTVNVLEPRQTGQVSAAAVPPRQERQARRAVCRAAQAAAVAAAAAEAVAMSRERA